VEQTGCPSAAVYVPAEQVTSHELNGVVEVLPALHREHTDAAAAE
jgi:hypothetical protein